LYTIKSIGTLGPVMYRSLSYCQDPRESVLKALRRTYGLIGRNKTVVQLFVSASSILIFIKIDQARDVIVRDRLQCPADRLPRRQRIHEADGLGHYLPNRRRLEWL